MIDEQDTRAAIVRGMATIFWGSAWADHAEEHACCSLSGAQIEEVMPAIPPCAWEATEARARRIEEANDATLDELFARAMAADAVDPSAVNCARRRNTSGLDDPECFGNCLAYMTTGAGISWFDDHAEFPLEVPHDAGMTEYPLMIHAAETCREKTSRVQCEGCSAYNDPGKRDTCHGCGADLGAVDEEDDNE